MKLFQALGAFAGIALLAACDATTVQPAPDAPGQVSTTRPSEAALVARQAARNFIRVVQTVEPVAERECRSRTSGVNCNFRIVVDDRPGQPANAFQTLDDRGRPIIAFTLGLIAEARNEDELAFVLGHEAAHHVQQHIRKQQQNVAESAVLEVGLTVLGGGDQKAVDAAKLQGAKAGARRYSKEYELEADALGTIITARAGYDPVRGAQFFARIPDPGDKFLGTHPPNAARLEIVRRTAAGL